MKSGHEPTRCPWVNMKNQTYIDYHDHEWGRPIIDDQTQFEFLCLEGAQAGLSWETVLKKRNHYKKRFFNFDPLNVSQMTKKDIEDVLKDPGIIRNRLKVESCVHNAKLFLQIQDEYGSFCAYLWSFVAGEPQVSRLRTLMDYPARTDLSDSISFDLKKKGFKFVGPTIIYAHLQATGIVNDHALDCFVRQEIIDSYSSLS